MRLFRYNDRVYRAAANDIDFINRAARGSVWNGLLSGYVVQRIIVALEWAITGAQIVTGIVKH